MAPPALVPVELRTRPFSLAEARRHGLTKHHLQGDAWRNLGSGFYAWKEIAADPLVILGAVRRRIPDGSAFAGRTAGWLHGLDLSPCDPIEVAVPLGCGVSGRAGIKLRRVELPGAEVVTRDGLPVTSAVRTLADLGRCLSLVEGVVALDGAFHQGLADLPDVWQWVEDHPGYPGTARLRRALGYVEPDTESPMETRLRLLLVQAGLPKPQVQISLYDGTGTFLGRPDLYYPMHRLCIEYDGSVHRDSLVGDNRRQNRLLDAGYRMLRFAASDVLSAPDSVVLLVRRALATSMPAVAGKGGYQAQVIGVNAGNRG